MLHPAKTASATFAQKRAKIKVGQIASSAFLVKNRERLKIYRNTEHHTKI